MGFVGAGPSEGLALEGDGSLELEPLLSREGVNSLLLGALLAHFFVLSRSHSL